MERKIIQITAGSLHQEYVNSHVVYALCNDGTLWEIEHNKKWKRLPNIPQDEVINSLQIPKPIYQLDANSEGVYFLSADSQGAFTVGYHKNFEAIESYIESGRYYKDRNDVIQVIKALTCNQPQAT